MKSVSWCHLSLWKTCYSWYTVEDVCSSSALENDGDYEVSSVIDSSSEIIESESVSQPFLSLQIEVKLYRFKLEHLLGESDIVDKTEDAVEMDPSHAAWVSNNNWYIH